MGVLLIASKVLDGVFLPVLLLRATLQRSAGQVQT